MKWAMMKGICVFLTVLMTLGTVTLPAFSASDQPEYDELMQIAEAAVARKAQEVGSNTDLLTERFLRYAGTTAGDWYPFLLGRLGIEDRSADYLAVLYDNVESRYRDEDLLDPSKATEWHRIALAILALGGDPCALGVSDIDLIRDGVWNRVDADGNAALGRQGINGYIWGLIAVDSLYYAEPQDGLYSREDMLSYLAQHQLMDGGWSLSGDSADADMTAMALQALAPYRNMEAPIGDVQKSVHEMIESALACLSALQSEDGSFLGWGRANCGSTAQVIVALCSLEIDLFTDSRFLKSGNTLFDALMRFQLEGGGFSDSIGGAYDSRSGEQALCALTALIRFRCGARRLYDCRAEQSDAVRAQITAVEEAIADLHESSSPELLQSVYTNYLAIDASERSYVANYQKLSALLRSAGISYAEESIQYAQYAPQNKATVFSADNIAQTRALPQRLTLADRPAVLRLWYRLMEAEPFPEYEEMRRILDGAKEQIGALLAEVEALNTEIREELYPFDSIGLFDHGTVNELYARYMALSEYDRTYLSESDREGLMRAKASADTALRTALISGCGVAVILLAILFLRLQARRRRLREMPESDE